MQSILQAELHTPSYISRLQYSLKHYYIVMIVSISVTRHCSVIRTRQCRHAYGGVRGSRRGRSYGSALPSVIDSSPLLVDRRCFHAFTSLVLQSLFFFLSAHKQPASQQRCRACPSRCRSASSCNPLSIKSTSYLRGGSDMHWHMDR